MATDDDSNSLAQTTTATTTAMASASASWLPVVTCIFCRSATHDAVECTTVVTPEDRFLAAWRMHLRPCCFTNILDDTVDRCNVRCSVCSGHHNVAFCRVHFLTNRSFQITSADRRPRISFFDRIFALWHPAATKVASVLGTTVPLPSSYGRYSRTVNDMIVQQHNLLADFSDCEEASKCRGVVPTLCSNRLVFYRCGSARISAFLDMPAFVLDHIRLSFFDCDLTPDTLLAPIHDRLLGFALDRCRIEPPVSFDVLLSRLDVLIHVVIRHYPLPETWPLSLSKWKGRAWKVDFQVTGKSIVDHVEVLAEYVAKQQPGFTLVLWETESTAATEKLEVAFTPVTDSCLPSGSSPGPTKLIIKSARVESRVFVPRSTIPASETCNQASSD